MKKFFCFLVILGLTLFVNSSNFSQDSGPTQNRANILQDVTGDFNPALVSGRDLSPNYYSDVVSGIWTTVAPSPNALSRSCCVYARPGGVQYIYQFGGGAGVQLTSIARYDIAANTWLLLGQVLNLAVSSGTAINDGDSVIYIFGGNSPTTAAQKFNVITGITTTLAPMPNRITDAAVVKHRDSLIYIIGGGTGLFGAGYVANTDVYNIKTNTYAAATAYPIAAGMQGCGIDGNEIVVAAGWNGITGVANAYVGTIDPGNHLIIAWTAIPNYPGGGVTRAASYFLTSLTNRGVMFTGGAVLGATLTNKTYFYNLTSDLWDSAAVLPVARSNMKAAGRGDSVIWVVAGFTTVGVGNTDRFSPPSAGLANDVGITAINIPLDPFDSKSFIPCATVRNFGTNNQLTPFPVTATISPGGYTSTVTDTVSAGLSNQVCFAKFIPASDTQTYTITVYTSLGSDQDRNNDTMRITRKFPKANSSYDPICQYYAANSIAPLGFPLPQPQSRPEYCWKDTTGSINLILNTTNRGTLFGSLDDGHYRLRIKDILLATNQDTTGKRIKYCGTCYDSIFPGTNGVIGLTLADGNATFLNSFTIDTVNAAYNALFPLWKDNNFGVLGTGAGSNRLSVKIKDHQLIITYDRVAAFSNNAMWTSHQTVMEIVKDCADPNSNFRYTYTDTTTGQSSGAFVTNYFNSFNAVPPAATLFFNNFVGITGPSPNSMSIFRGYSSPANPFAGPNLVDIKRNIYNPTTRRALTLEYGPDPNVLNEHDCLTLTASVALEGLQRNPQPRVRDTIDIELRDCQSPPYKLMQKARVYLSDSVVAGARRYGRVSIELSLLKRNFPYYLRIRHRNSIASWSQSVITLTGDTLSYDFTSALTQIFGNNGVLVNGNASFYSGDVNQDGVVDGSDLSAIDNDAFNFVQGGYVITDLNWDGIVDGSDAAIADNNATNFVQEVAPPGFVVDDSYAELPTYDYNYNESEIIVIPDLYAKPKTDTYISEQKSRNK